MTAIMNDADAAEHLLWDRLIIALRRSQRWQLAIKLVLVLLGGTLAGLAQLPFPWADPTKLLLGGAGAAMALTGGALLLLIDNENVAALEQARATVKVWRATISNADRLEGERQQLEQSLRRSKELTVTFDTMIRFLEFALALDGVTLEQRLDRFIGPVAPALIGSMGLGGQHSWTISIFRKQAFDGEERMVRVASNWADREGEREDTRAWRRGKGWTGMAWLLAEERPKDPYVVEADTATEAARSRYDTDDQGDELDYGRFRSVAAVPFRDSRTREVMGVVTATSSRPGAFGVDRNTPGRRNLDTIKSFSLLVSALAAGAQAGS